MNDKKRNSYVFNANNDSDGLQELKTAVNLWISDNATALGTYGEINTWDVSNVTDMSELFKNKTTFNDDISDWDVSSVTNMNSMFDKAYAFNQPLGNWDVSFVNNSSNIQR